MNRTETLTVRNRRRYRVNVTRLVDEVPDVQDRGITGAPNTRRRTRPGALVGRIHDGGSRISTTARRSDPSDLVNQYLANHYESGPTPTISQIDVMRRDLFAQAELPPVAYEHSGRLSYGNMVPIGANDETDGIAMALFLERRKFEASDPDAKRSFGVNSLAAWIHAMRTPAEQLAAFDASTADMVNNDVSTIRARIERLQLEGFDAATIARAQRDLAFVPDGLQPGMHCPSFTGGAVYHSFDPLDTVNFHTTREQSSAGAYAVPWMPVGDDTTTTFDLIAEPKLFQIRFTWVAVYVVFVLFAPPTLIAEVNLGSYSDRLPLGFAYREEPEQSINDTHMSQWIGESNRFALALRQDLASQRFSLYFQKILLYRVDGLWEFFSPMLNVGDLAAILDVRRGGHSSRRDRHYVYRKTAVPGGFGAAGVQGFGSLHVPGLVLGHNKAGPTFQGGREYGPF